MAKRKEQPAEEGSPAWMATFSDLMNLLLCFFVLLFASSSMDEGKIQKIAASFENATFSIFTNSSSSLFDGSMMSGGVTQLSDSGLALSTAGQSMQDNMGSEENVEEGETHQVHSTTDASALTDEELQKEFDKRGEEQSEQMYDEMVSMMESYRIEDSVAIDFTSQYVELDLNGSILFASGSDEIKDDSKLFLQKIASVLVKYKYSTIEIEGHTDNVPISSGSRYENNRELSVERARSVYEYIMTQENFIDENMKIAGYGESKPIASNSTEEGRAKNRRVTIKIYNQQNSYN